MDAIQWQRVREIFDAAIDLEPQDRPEFIRACSKGDEFLQQEVLQLLEADARADGFLGADWLAPLMPPLPAEFVLEPGDVVCDRFRIVRAVGAGGMGRVYEAYDAMLGVRVALKTIRPEIAMQHELLLRFHQEVKIGHSVTHPNVCRTFHLDHEVRPANPGSSQTVTLTFVTMEFLDGETLAEMLRRRERLPLDEALAVAEQMADGIDAAHRQGIIHRDIKPGNVMICRRDTPSGATTRVVITDFGLAKMREAASGITSLSVPGRPMGTPAYMAPEQVRGLEATAASDIYAFGLVLFEMVTGRKPTTAITDTVRGSASAAPASFFAGEPVVPQAWQQAIWGCLRPDPADRFASALDVVAVLHGARPSEIRRRRVSQSRATIQPRRRWVKATAIAAAVLFFVAVSIFVWRWRLYQVRGNAGVSPGAMIYLAPILNRTDDPKLDAVTELLRASLDQSVQANLLGDDAVQLTLQKMSKPANAAVQGPSAREVALRNGASRVILPTLSRSGDAYTLHIDLQQPDSNGPARPRAQWQKDFHWTATGPATNAVSPEMIAAIRNATDWTRLQIGESQKDIVSLNASPEDVTTDRWDALLAFTQAERQDALHKKWEAVLSLQQAVRLDPHFAVAYARLGDILFSVDRDAEGVAAYRHALDASTDRPLSRKELDRVQGMYAIDTYDNATAVEAFRDYEAFYPNDYIGWAYPTQALRALNLDEQAVANLRKAAALKPDNSMPVLLLGDELMVTGHLEEIPHWVDVLRAKGLESAALQMEAQRRFLTFDFDGTYEELAKLAVSPDLNRRLRGMRTAVRVAAEQGDVPRALRFANDAIAEAHAQGETGTEAVAVEDRAALECATRNYAGCVADIDKALAMDSGRRTLLEAEDILGEALQSASPVEAGGLRSQVHRIEATVNRIDFGFVTRAMRVRAHAESLLADRQYDAAVEEMRKAAALDAPSGSREYLGRALVAAATVDRSHARDLLVQAEAAYGAVALHPNAAWTDTWNFHPGFLAQQAGAYLRLADQLGDHGNGPAQVQAFYAHLRPSSPKPAPAGHPS